jgi:GxxExxY protein
LRADVLFKGKKMGIYFFDFLIEDRIALELKARNYFSYKDIEQLYSYLKVKNLKLGILAYFGKDGVKFRRILNIK